ncbi:MAG: UbiH/UbiF/VisC/COQ6 family ubiquinone biosynthesis hydroxylase [Alphaproteobacteria bacterium]|jgi:2-octaprenyl-6-methoxyphenol hydroxylase|nr:UbiH/UbiF/VisC/COQ6 family ubiquinone biosynthesis hydroxylase [Alphaproteobacteria bacterium]MDP6566672.1 UbiH/UbiF/VisC/COQ6 family ubiquinone biosynthesis hydroxylase [Alphaproteobacteria bacterium]MDP6813034.1 UbiH/UbiF/VisC/COQ6 family ubiquinone biosynthesis hydroxylase [Alphaproteobacteria bacterium]
MAGKGQIDTDLLIIGGGMVGLAQALAVASAGLRVVVVEHQDPGALTGAGHDGRVSSVSYGSHALFDRIGAWRHMSSRAGAIREIRVADGGAPLFLHFDHRDVGDRPFGYMVENRHIRLALGKALADAPDVTLLAPAEATEVRRQRTGVVARLADGCEIRAPLVVGAEGRQSPLRRQAGIRCLSWQYGQTAIVTTLRHQLPHHGVANELFLAPGPFALLPMRGKRSALVWTERHADVPALLALDDDAFDGEIMARAGDHWGRIHCDAPRWSYPLGLQNAERYIDTRLALIGDAAHGMHPVAGQGLNLGLRDVAALAEVLVDAARLGLDIGGDEVLRRYQRWRRFDALTMLVMTDGLVRLFSNDIAPLRLARILGLGLVDRIGPAKRFFERHAAAISGDLPKLIRGEAL